jgi:hypothetical protein
LATVRGTPSAFAEATADGSSESTLWREGFRWKGSGGRFQVEGFRVEVEKGAALQIEVGS